MNWINSRIASDPTLKSKSQEAQLVEVARGLLGQFSSNIEPEYVIEGTPYRIDLKAELPNGEFALVEVKAFRDDLTPYVDAVIQAASYAEAIKYPVFIGPIEGSRETLSTGRLDSALSALHLMAGRLNVGFLYVSGTGNAGLLLKGQRLIDAGSVSSNFSNVWAYRSRRGSKWVKS